MSELTESGRQAIGFTLMFVMGAILAYFSRIFGPFCNKSPMLAGLSFGMGSGLMLIAVTWLVKS